MGREKTPARSRQWDGQQSSSRSQWGPGLRGVLGTENADTVQDTKKNCKLRTGKKQMRVQRNAWEWSEAGERRGHPRCMT